MNTNYNLRRILLALRADWMEYKKNYLLIMGVLFLVWMLILFIVHINKSSDTPLGFWAIGMLVVLVTFCQHAGRKIHRQRERFLMLPANTGEKYTALLLEGLAYFGGFQIVFWLGFWIWKPFIASLPIPSLSYIDANGSESAVFFIASLLFLSHLTFRRHASLIMVGGLVAYVFLFVTAAIYIVGGTELSRGRLEAYYPFYRGTLDFLGSYFTPAMIVSTLVVMYASYLKVKEKELR
jgi:hypothetical protein